MLKTNSISFLTFQKFYFGDQVVSQFIFFECKWIFSIVLFYFHKTNKSQDRFHTHAFNSISFKLFGTYKEYVLDDVNTGKYHIEVRDKIFQFFPKNRYHKIGNSTGCSTILITGPWDKEWEEYKDGEIIKYTWGR